MHNHDEDKQSSWMMWAMMLCCALPLVIVLLGFGAKTFGASTWVVAVGVIVMLVAHLFMMKKMNKRSDDQEHDMVVENKGENKVDENSQSHSGHGCCH